MTKRTLACVSAAALLFAAAGVSAHAQCPDLSSHGSATTGCNEVVTLNSDGSFSVVPGIGTTYDGSDDAVVGFLNNSGHSVSSISLNGNGVAIFGFDGDGIDTFGAPSNSKDTTGYGGPNVYFTGISPDGTQGTVDFINPVAAGGSDYFSLEEAFDPSNPPTPGGGGSSVTPEPNSLMLMGTGVLGLAGAVRKRLQRA